MQYFNTIQYLASIGDESFGSANKCWVEQFVNTKIGEHSLMKTDDVVYNNANPSSGIVGDILKDVLTNDVIYDIVKHGHVVGRFITRFTCE